MPDLSLLSIVNGNMIERIWQMGRCIIANPRDVEFEEVQEFTQTDFHELAKQYKQRSGEPLLTWLLCLWNEGADSVVLSGKEAVTMGVLTHDPQLRQAM